MSLFSSNQNRGDGQTSEVNSYILSVPEKTFLKNEFADIKRWLL